MEDVKLTERIPFEDNRGSLCELFRGYNYFDLFCQDNIIFSHANVLRGIHYQTVRPQAKLITCLMGVIIDVVVDVDRRSSTFGSWARYTLSADNMKMLYIPPTCAHALYSVTDSIVFYKMTNYYDKEHQQNIAWNDPTLAIDWPCSDPILSEADANAKSFLECYPCP